MNNDDSLLFYWQLAAQERKNFIQTMELQRQHNEPLNDLEEEAKERAQHLLVKANEQRQEQEDEIKHLNEVHVTVLIECAIHMMCAYIDQTLEVNYVYI